MVGSATFTDKRNQLYGEVTFGKVAGAEDETLLQRTDAIRTEVCLLAADEPQRTSSPDPTTSSNSNTVGPYSVWPVTACSQSLAEAWDVTSASPSISLSIQGRP